VTGVRQWLVSGELTTVGVSVIDLRMSYDVTGTCYWLIDIRCVFVCVCVCGGREIHVPCAERSTVSRLSKFVLFQFVFIVCLTLEIGRTASILTLTLCVFSNISKIF